MEQGIKLMSTNQEVRSIATQDLKDFNEQSLTTQAKKGEQLVAMMPAVKKAFRMMTDDIVELSTENGILKDKIGNYDNEWLQKSKQKMLEETKNDKRAQIVMERMRAQLAKMGEN